MAKKSTEVLGISAKTRRWTREIPAAVVRHVLSAGPLTLSITPGVGRDTRCWQFVLLSLGQHTERPVDQCIGEWPREAIRLLRAAIDELEATLNEEEP